MQDAAHLMELQAMEAQFRAMVRRWCLTSDEEIALLGKDGPKGAEESKRLLLEFDRSMRGLFGEEGVRCWLRDRAPTGLSPIGCLMLGREQQKAFLAAARQRHYEVLGYHA